MSDIDERFRALEGMRAPDVWEDATGREPGPLPAERRLPTRVGAFAGAVIATTAVVVLVMRAFSGGDHRSVPGSTSETPTGAPLTAKVVDTFPVGPKGQTNSILAADGSVWVSAYGVNTGTDTYLFRIDPATDEVVARIPIDSGPTWETGGGGTAFAFGSVWVAGVGDPRVPGGRADAMLQRVDPATNKMTSRIWLGGRSGAAIGVDDTSLWVALFSDGNDPAQLVRVDPITEQILARIPLQSGYARWVIPLDGKIFVGEFVWENGLGPSPLVEVVDAQREEVVARTRGAMSSCGLFEWRKGLWSVSGGSSFTALDPSTLEPQGEAVPANAVCWSEVSAPPGIWFVDYQERLGLFDPGTRTVDKLVDTPQGAIALAASEGSVWLLDHGGNVTRVDVSANASPAT